MDLINQLPADVKASTTHYIQDLIIEGREEEREKTKRKAVQNMVAKGFPIEIICEIQEVSVDFVEKVRNEQP